MIHSPNPPSSDADNLLVIFKHLISCLPDEHKHCLTRDLEKEIQDRVKSGVDGHNASVLQEMAKKAGLKLSIT